jgi:hypothetical protein
MVTTTNPTCNRSPIMITPVAMKTLQILGSKLAISVAVNGDRLTFQGATGEHSLDVTVSGDARAFAHFRGYAESQPAWEQGLVALERGAAKNDCGICDLIDGEAVECTRGSRPYGVPGVDGYVDACRFHAREEAWEVLEMAARRELPREMKASN